jgi:hypothetical protein
MPESISLSTHYASYLLRLRWSWQVDEWSCQILLTHVATQEQRYFAGMESLFAYLHQQREAEKGGKSPGTSE